MAAGITLAFHHGGKIHSHVFPEDATLQTLSDHVSETLDIPNSNQKFLISPKPGLIKPPFDGSDRSPLLLKDVATAKKIVLLGSTSSQIEALNHKIKNGATQANRRIGDGPVKAAAPSRTRDWKQIQDEMNYTFHDVKPLDFLPFPERSTAYLNKLRDDPGIKAAMVKHKWSVPLLTELNPAENTTHESRTLGLNENKGQKILLRLRTDDYDGYRDYKTVRDCLCHELAHNVHGDHNRDFYDLMKQIQEEVKRNDWKHGGKALSNSEFYETGPEEADPERQLVGGIQRLGSGSANNQSQSTSSASSSADARRERMARAAEARMNRRDSDDKAEGRKEHQQP